MNNMEGIKINIENILVLAPHTDDGEIGCVEV